MGIKHFTVSLPQYTIDKQPDDKAIGKTIDDVIKRHFMGKSVLIRGVASSEHPGKSVAELANIIEVAGTDRYDIARAGDRYDNIEGKHIDLFAFPATISEDIELARNIIWGFYHSSIGVHGRPYRIDIITIYDASQMTQVLHQYEGRDDIKDDGFVFKYPDNKAEALLGIIKIN